MASTSNKKSDRPPAAQRKLRKANKANLYAAQNDEITFVGFGASAGDLKALQEFLAVLPSILINDRYAILHVSETAGRYLVPPSGPITNDLLKLVRPELQLELRTALLQVFEKGQTILTPPISVEFNGNPHPVVIFIKPRLSVTEPGGKSEKQALIFFLEDEQAAQRDETGNNALVKQLENEVQRLREQLQVTMKEYENSNEEMKAANEELQSINEEYRSVTEELETSKEELQSVNEELQTVNSEMRGKLDEIARAQQDLENLMGTTEIATLFLDPDMRIQRFSAGMQELFSMLQLDRGRRITDLTHKLGYNEFVEDAQRALYRLLPVERQIQTPEGKWFLIRLRPNRTIDDRIEGVVITFIDINRLKKTEQELVRARDLLEERVQDRTRDLDHANQKISAGRDLFSALFSSNPIPTALVRIEDGIFLDVNNEFLEYFGIQRDQVIGRRAEEFSVELVLDAQLRRELKTRIKDERRTRNVEMEIVTPSGEARNILASVQLIDLEDTSALIATFTDITDRVRAEQQIRSLASELTATEQAERHRLSQILHDDLQQRIFAIQMQLSFLKDAYEKNDLKAFAIDFPQIEEWLAEAIKVTRRLSVDLSPPILHGEGLLEAVVWLAAQMDEQYGLKIDIKSSGMPIELDEKVRVLVFYAVRELLFNIVKHADVLEAVVRFEHYDAHLRVIVRDSGKGFKSIEVINDPSKAHGLLIIRHRLSLLGCRLEINSNPGDGAEAIIEVPYK